MKRVVWIVAALALIVGCGKDKQTQQAAPAVVNAVTVLQQDLPWNMEYPAQVVGSLDIQVRAQVGGILEARLYNEGEYVEAGTQLFQIDDQPYKVALEKANGALAQAQAEEKRTQRTYARIKSLRIVDTGLCYLHIGLGRFIGRKRVIVILFTDRVVGAQTLNTRISALGPFFFGLRLS